MGSRCVTCGKLVESDSRVVRIGRGVWTEQGGYQEKEEFGILHTECFDRSVESPTTALQEIKRLAKAATKLIKPPGKRRGRPPKSAAAAPAATPNPRPATAARPRRGRRVRGREPAV